MEPQRCVYVPVPSNVCTGSLGDILTTVTTHMRPNSFAAVSPCGRFVICTGVLDVYISMYVI